MSQNGNAAEVSNRALKRYSDAYSVARATTAIGRSIKGIALLLFVIDAGAGYYIATQQQGGDARYTIGGILCGVFIAIPVYVLGVLVSAQGQLLKAALDGAVHSSPFLDVGQKAKVMSLE